MELQTRLFEEVRMRRSDGCLLRGPKCLLVEVRRSSDA